jgi:fatty-acyl-CoA synthase
MTAPGKPMTDEQKPRFNVLNKENLGFLMDRYNRINRWVIADVIRRTAYHSPDKTPRTPNRT